MKAMLQAMLLLLGVIGWLFGSGLSHGTSEEKVRVTTSFYPLFEFARNIGADRVDVVNLVAAGAEPHDFEPTPQEIRRIQESHVFIYLGAGFDDAWVERVLQAIDTSRLLVVKATDGLPLRQAPEGAEDFESDPHLWLDPLLAKGLVENITHGLSQADPPGQLLYDESASIERQKLEALDQLIRAGLTNCRLRELIISHTFLEYFAERYGLIAHALSGLEPGEPSPQRLAELIRLGREKGFRYVYAEPLVDLQGIHTLARELDAQILTLDSIEGLTDEAIARGEDYLSLMLQNLKHLRVGLQCQ
jgi:zinc transport system substrate-binding protein